MDEEQILNEIEALEQEQIDDDMEDHMENQSDLQEAYGHPEPEEKINQHAFIQKSVFESPFMEKHTFLQEGELGRPLFNVRFLLDMEDITKHYIDPLLKPLNLKPEDNKISTYFRRKIDNICSSGLSRDGFIQNVNITKKTDATRVRLRNPVENLQGRKK